MQVLITPPQHAGHQGWVKVIKCKVKVIKCKVKVIKCNVRVNEGAWSMRSLRSGHLVYVVVVVVIVIVVVIT